MRASTVPAAKAAILQLLSVAEGLEDAKLSWTEPIKATDFGRINICFGDTELEEDWRGLGAQRKTERYTLSLMQQVSLKNATPQESEETFWDIHAIVAAQLRGDVSLADLVLKCEVQGTVVGVTATPDGVRAEGVSRIGIEAII